MLTTVEILIILPKVVGYSTDFLAALKHTLADDQYADDSLNSKLKNCSVIHKHTLAYSGHIAADQYPRLMINENLIDYRYRIVILHDFQRNGGGRSRLRSKLMDKLRALNIHPQCVYSMCGPVYQLAFCFVCRVFRVCVECVECLSCANRAMLRHIAVCCVHIQSISLCCAALWWWWYNRHNHNVLYIGVNVCVHIQYVCRMNKFPQDTKHQLSRQIWHTHTHKNPTRPTKKSHRHNLFAYNTI